MAQFKMANVSNLEELLLYENGLLGKKTNYTDGVPVTYTKQLREKKCAIFEFTCPLNKRGKQMKVKNDRYLFIYPPIFIRPLKHQTVEIVGEQRVKETCLKSYVFNLGKERNYYAM